MCAIVFENQGSLRTSASLTVLFRVVPASTSWQQWYHIDHGSSLPTVLFENSPLAWFQKVYHKRDEKAAMGPWSITGACRETFSSQKQGIFLPSMIPQGVFLPRTLLPFTWYSLSLPTTAKGMLSCWGETCAQIY